MLGFLRCARVPTLLLATLLAAAIAPATAQDPPSASRPAATTPALRTIQVPLQGGRLALADLGRALLEAYGYESGELRMPDHTVDLRGTRGWLLLTAARKLLLDSVRFRRDLEQDQLVLTVDRVRARQARRDLRARVAQVLGRMAGEDFLERRYDLTLPPALDARRPVAILVHGVDSGVEAWSDVQEFLGQAPGRLQVGTFGWPNDESVDRVAAALASRLRELGEQPVALVAHSMGGLIARAVVEDPKLDPGNVKLLIQLGTPNHGSRLAGLRFGLEAAQVLTQPDGADAYGRELLHWMRDALLDGLGEAGGDLLPGSVCLGQLNARPRNPRVTYRLVLGTRSVLTGAELARARDRALALLGATKGTRTVRPKIERWLADLDELVDGRGDGAVSVERGRLPGVEPVLVPLDHVGLIRREGLLGSAVRAEDHPVFTRVAGWLRQVE